MDHITDHDLERYYLGMVISDDELTTMSDVPDSKIYWPPLKEPLQNSSS